MTEVRFVDTTLRDGQQSLWAYNMRTGMMVPIVELMDQAGFEAIELGGPVELPKCIKELREDPWERYRLVIPKFKKTPLRLIHGTRSGFAIYPQALHQLYDTCMANAGVSEVRISDSWNDPTDWAWRVTQAKNAGLKPIINLIYPLSPRHTDEYFAAKIRQAFTLDVYRVILKDPGGILTPERTKTLVPTVLNAAGAKTVELHTHCTTGLGTLCCLEAIKAGMTHINTAIPPLADGSSNPSLFNVAMNARSQGFKIMINEKPLRAVADHFTACAKRDNLPIGKPPEYDYAQYVHQIPGGMISNGATSSGWSAWRTSLTKPWRKQHRCAPSSATRSWSRRCRNSSAAKRLSTSSSANVTSRSPIRLSNTPWVFGAKKAPNLWTPT
jgi:oxaloacetate decarboxylase (Na+ extruding) subunit alpha